MDSDDSTVSTLPESTAEESSASEETPANTEPSGEGSTVYFTDDISPEGMLAAFNALGWQPTGKVAVKLSTGEPPASNYLRPELIVGVVKEVYGTIVECNTAYGGSRSETAMHYQVAEDHGFTAIADFKILDEDGPMTLPVNGGSQLTENYVGTAYAADGSESLRNRVNDRNGLHVLEHAEEIGLGSREYKLVDINDRDNPA